MKRKLVFLAICGMLTLVPKANAQELSEVTRVVGGFLQNDQTELAKQRLEAYLQLHPEDADAWMMQGNLLLRERQAVDLTKFCLIDESIFTRFNGAVENVPLVIGQPVALEVAEAWQKALAIDPARTELHEGLAFLYAQALMKTELLTELANLKVASGEPKDLKFLMCDLARILAERHALTDALEVYRAILGYYPEEPAVYADLAETLLRYGKSEEARRYLEIGALLTKGDKRQLYQTAFHFWTVTGNYIKAQEALQSWSGLTHQRDGQFYKGLLLYSGNNSKWLAEMKSFLAAPYDQCEKAQRDLAGFLVSSANRHDYASYIKSLNFRVEPAMVLLLHKRALVKFPGQAAPYLKLVEFLSSYCNYSEALRILRGMNSKMLFGPELTDSFHLQSAWALQNIGDIAGADQSWMKLFNAKEYFIKSAAIYFYGKNRLASGKPEEAAKFFRMIANQATSSKYAFYSSVVLRQIETGTGLNVPLETLNGVKP